MAVVDEQAVELGKLKSSGWIRSGVMSAGSPNMMSVVCVCVCWTSLEKGAFLLLVGN